MVSVDPVLQRFRVDLDNIFGTRLERVVLYGSRARGDARPDSDYDVAVFLKDYSDRWQEVSKILPAVTDILYSDLAVINALPFSADSYVRDSSLMDAIRREGVSL